MSSSDAKAIGPFFGCCMLLIRRYVIVGVGGYTVSDGPGGDFYQTMSREAASMKSKANALWGK